MKLAQFLKAISVVTQIIDASIAIEGMIGLSGGFTAQGSLGVKARISLSGEVGVIDRTLFMEEGQFLHLDAGDSFEKPFSEIEKIANTALSNTKSDSVRNNFIYLPQ